MLLCFIKVYLKPFQHQVVLWKRIRAAEHVALRQKVRNRLIKRVRKGAVCAWDVSFLGGSPGWRAGLAPPVQGGPACRAP